jgi:hypothetical protein
VFRTTTTTSRRRPDWNAYRRFRTRLEGSPIDVDPRRHTSTSTSQNTKTTMPSHHHHHHHTRANKRHTPSRHHTPNHIVLLAATHVVHAHVNVNEHHPRDPSRSSYSYPSSSCSSIYTSTSLDRERPSVGR